MRLRIFCRYLKIFAHLIVGELPVAQPLVEGDGPGVFLRDLQTDTLYVRIVLLDPLEDLCPAALSSGGGLQIQLIEPDLIPPGLIVP